MYAISRITERGLEPHVTAPARPVQADEACLHDRLADYVGRARGEAGSPYQAAGSKMWWLP